METHRNLWPMTVLVVLALLPSTTLSMADGSTPAPQPTKTLKQQLDAICVPTEGQLREQLAKAPNDISIRMKLAACLAVDGRPKEAIVEYTKVIAADRKNIPAMLARAGCYERIHDLSLAFIDCRSAVETDSANTDALKAYVLTANKCGKLSQALTDLRSLARLDAAKAASCYWIIAQSIVDRDYYGAQPYAKAAHDLAPKIYSNEIHPNPIRRR
jgi:tetratricopeptide (TPR) repeat protein